MKYRAVLALLLAIFAAAQSLLAQTPSTARDGIYTAAQAARGKALYFDNCVACHGDQLQGGEDSPPLAGVAFLHHWGGMSTGALYGFVNSQMPLGAPGSLGAGASADIVAYILSVNQFPAGNAELPADPKALNGMVINK